MLMDRVLYYVDPKTGSKRVVLPKSLGDGRRITVDLLEVTFQDNECTSPCHVISGGMACTLMCTTSARDVLSVPLFLVVVECKSLLCVLFLSSNHFQLVGVDLMTLPLSTRLRGNHYVL